MYLNPEIQHQGHALLAERQSFQSVGWPGSAPPTVVYGLGEQIR